MRPPATALAALLAAACTARRDGEPDPAAAAPGSSVRLLDAPERIAIRSPWDPAAIAADPIGGLAPLLEADFDAALPAGAVAFGGPEPQLAAEAAARGARGVRFEPASGALCLAVRVNPEAPYFVEVAARTTVAAESRRTARSGQLVVIELHRLPRDAADLEKLLARVSEQDELVLAVHAAEPASATGGGFARARLAVRTTGRTRALIVALIGGLPTKGDAEERATGRADFDELALYELPLSRYLALQSTARLRDVELLGEQRRALLAPPGTRIDIPLSLPAGRCRLSFGYAVLDDRRGEAGRAPIRFRASLERAGATTELLAAEVTPSASPDSRLWQELSRELDLGGGEARLVLETESARACEEMAAFAEPRVDPLADPKSLPPDVLLISLDTLRADRLGCYGYARPDGVPTSPRIDELARSSLRFAQARALAPWTLPSHATMFTGLAPAAHRVVTPERRLLPDRHPLLALEFARAGYATAAFTAGGFVAPEHGFAAGFDRYTIVDPCRADLLGGAAVAPRRGDPAISAAVRARFGRDGIERWLEAQAGRPCFLFVHTYVVHDYVASAELEHKFGLDETRTALLPSRVVRQIDERMRLEPGFFTPERAATVRDLYDATIAAADEEVGALLDALERCGRLDRTIVALVSDHGEEHGEHGGMGHGLSLYEEQLRVPFLLRVPGIGPGVIDEPVDLADLAPTLREAAGLPPVEPCDGESVLARVRDGRFAESFFAEVSKFGSEQALRIGRMKLLSRPPDLPENASRRMLRPVAWELYDLDADPLERDNLLDPIRDPSPLAARADLSEAWRAIARRFEAERARWRTRGETLVPDLATLETTPSDEHRRRLAELGYAAH